MHLREPFAPPSPPCRCCSAPALAAHAADIDTSKPIKVAMVPKLVGLSVFKANEQGAQSVPPRR